MSFDIFQGKQNDPVTLRAMAAASRQRSSDSFDRCDTDGFLSQWANDITAQQLTRQAEIAEAGGKAQFEGLYDGDRRVPAKVIWVPKYNAPWATEPKWKLRDQADCIKFDREYIPYSRSYKSGSRIQKQLGLTQRMEMASASTRLGSHGKSTGLAGCANAFVEIYRTGCPWGTDATPV